MSTASLENSKRLYELSGWHNTDFYHEDLGGGISKLIDRKRLETRWRHKDAAPDAIPAYSLGFLIRKLPHWITLGQTSGGYTPTGWYATKESSQDYHHTDPSKITVKTDTPEDALCLLAIKLFEEGVL